VRVIRRRRGLAFATPACYRGDHSRLVFEAFIDKALTVGGVPTQEDPLWDFSALPGTLGGRVPFHGVLLFN
jgi:hypothetical protein